MQTSASIYIGERTQALTKTSAAFLSSTTAVLKPAAPPMGVINLESASHLFAQKTVDESVAVFLKTAATFLNSCAVVYFKYFPNRRVLMATQSHGLSGVEIGGVGVNFNESGAAFRTSHLRDPQGIEELNLLVREIFAVKDFFALPVFALGEVQGVVVFMRPDPKPDEMAVLHDWLILLNKAVELLESEKRLHVLAIKDSQTDLLNRQNFVMRLQNEVSRARRINLPVALAIMVVDQYHRITNEIGAEEGHTIMRMVARICEKHSRVNDVLGRTGNDELGLILPHTSKQGALIKIERLRRIIQGADFSKVLSAYPHITISIGVSEYPSFVRDAEELQVSADEALQQVRKVGNKTCVAKAHEGFVPDFVVTETAEKK
jgi:diguanylate cyclase (GGDEF)-like protein